MQMRDECKEPDDGLLLNGLVIGYRNGKNTKPVAGPLSLSLASGSMVCLCGPNGGGKSTLLKTIAGFLPPLEGTVSINGINMQQATPRTLTTLISVVLTHRPQLHATTARELVALGRAPYTGFFGRLSNSDEQMVEQAMQFTGTQQLAQRNIDTLSDGERQKLMIAKALCQDTQVILLDEPTAFLDYPSKVEIMQTLKQLAECRNKIIILSTHDLDIAFSLAPSVWLIDKEHGFTVGTLEELGTNGVLTRYFTNKNLRFDTDTKRFVVEQSQPRLCYIDKNFQKL